MHRLTKKYFVYFFLFLLLFPLAEKGVHALEHHDEVHCTITDKHFHEQEHECSICDFTISDNNNLPSDEIAFVLTSQIFSFQEFILEITIPFSFSNLPSRAPPLA